MAAAIAIWILWGLVAAPALLTLLAVFTLLLVFRVQSLHDKVDSIMATEQELQQTLDDIKTRVANVATLQAAEVKTIADLQAQIAAGTPVSQAQLDSLVDEARSIKDALQPFAEGTV